MKKHKKRKPHANALPKDATEDQRLVALVCRLYTGVNAKGQTVCTLPKEFLPKSSEIWKLIFGPGPLLSSRVRELLLAAAARKLILKEPEFSRGSGAKLGSKHKNVRTDVTPEAEAKRRNRAKKAHEARIILVPGEEPFELEPGVDADMVRSALASLGWLKDK